ncbi:MAG: hypothetical protein AAF485_25800, partial [Chloroflexota bacterium]
VAVANQGTGPASNILITDTLPSSNISVITATMSDGSTVSGSNPLVASVATLNAGESVTMTVVVTTSTVSTDTIITNVASAVADTLAVQSSQVVTHIITSTAAGSPSFSIVKSADPASGSTVAFGDVITYTIVVANSGDAATNVTIADAVPTDTAYIPGSLVSTQGTTTATSSNISVTVASLAANSTVTSTFQVSVTTNLTTTISNQASIDSDQTTAQTSNSVTHTVQGSNTISTSLYLPIVVKNYQGETISLQWDNLEPVRDKVSNSDGAAGLVIDGQNDGVFKLFIDVGSTGPKNVLSMTLISTQGVEWDTIAGNSHPVLGVFNGGSILNSPDGSISGILFNSGLIQVRLYASDDAGLTRFPTGTYGYTVRVYFTDGSILQSTTATFRPANNN